MSETREIRLKRLYMRSIRRGIKEMDLVLGHFAAQALSELEDLDLYEALLAESDHDIHGWLTRALPCPLQYQTLLAQIEAQAEALKGAWVPRHSSYV